MKTKIKKILVPVDFTTTSETAISQASTIAELIKAEIFLIHVIENDYYQFTVVPDIITRAPSVQQVEAAVSVKMNAVIDNIYLSTGITAHAITTSGGIDSEIIEYSKWDRFDLIVMGTHGASGYKEMFAGSNAQRVVTLSDIPVLTMQANTDKIRFQNILLPIDNSLHSREKINIAMEFAAMFGAKIHILGITDADEKVELNKFKIKLESLEKILRAENIRYDTTIEEGDSLALMALNYSENNNCDLIVINTGHESKITGVFLGAFAQQIVNHSKIPVLSIKHSAGDYLISTPGFGIF